jgi:hypothetical protein
MNVLMTYRGHEMLDKMTIFEKRGTVG